MHPTSTRRRVAALAVATATGMAVLMVTPVAQGQTVGILRTGENTRIAEQGAQRVRDIPGLAVNPANLNNIVAVEQDTLALNCLANASFDGGQTWQKTIFNPPAGFRQPNSPVTIPSCASFEGSVAWGSGLNVYAAHSSARLNQTAQVALVYRSTDGGRTWAPSIAMDAGPAPSYSSPEIAVCPAGGAGCPANADRVYVAATGTPAGGVANVFVARSDDFGSTWSTPVNASAGSQPTSTARAAASRPVIQADGTVAVAYGVPDPNPQAGPTAVTSVLHVARSANNGATWTTATVTPVRGYIDESGARFNGSNFPRMRGDRRNKNLYLVYMEGPPPGGRQDHFIHPDVDVMFTRSTDGGATWTAPKRINDDPPGLGAPATGPAQRHPDVSVAPDGRIDVVWQDRRHGYRSPTHSHLGNGEARMGDTYFTYSADGGNTFAKNRRVSDKSQNLDVGYDHYGQEYWSWGPALVELGNEQVVFAWMDSREGNFENENVDIYMSKINLQSPDAIPSKQIIEGTLASLSVSLSKYAYTGGPQAVLNVGFTNRAITRPVIVNEGDALGALTGAVLSRAYLGPLLATPAIGLSAEVKAEVTRMAPIGAFVIGSESTLSPAVITNLVSAGVPADEITRIAGTPAEVAKTIALGLDRRSDAQKGARAPAFDAAVIVNPASQEAFAAAGLAASARLPILFTEAGSVPAATTEALAALNINSTLVIGSTAVISSTVASSLPGAKRLGGADPAAVSQAVLTESVARGLPLNIVHVADSAQGVDIALSAAAVARTGGLQVVVPNADTTSATSLVTAAGLRNQVDRFVVVRSSAGFGGPGYRLVARDGGIFAFGGAGFFGSTGGMRLAQPMVGMANSPSNLGYWTVAADGGVFAFGDARFRGSTGAIRLAQPMVGMAPTPSGNGYWLVARDGGVFAFGDATFFGSTGGQRLAQPIVGMAATPSGKGYWLVAADGGVFAFGDAPFRGSTGALRLAQPVVGMASTPSGSGYWLVARDGGIFAFGDAPFRGSTGAIRLAQPMVGMDATSSGNGYLLTASDGGVFAFGDARFAGSTGGQRLNQPVVALSAG